MRIEGEIRPSSSSLHVILIGPRCPQAPGRWVGRGAGRAGCGHVHLLGFRPLPDRRTAPGDRHPAGRRARHRPDDLPSSGASRRMDRARRHPVVTPGTELDHWGQAMKAALLAGPLGAVTGMAALRLHGLDVPMPSPIRVVVPMQSHVPRHLDGEEIRVVASRTLRDGDVLARRRVPITTPARSFLDLALPPSPAITPVRDTLVTALQRRVLDQADLHRAIDGARGHAGATPAVPGARGPRHVRRGLTLQPSRRTPPAAPRVPAGPATGPDRDTGARAASGRDLLVPPCLPGVRRPAVAQHAEGPRNRPPQGSRLPRNRLAVPPDRVVGVRPRVERLRRRAR